MILRRRFHSTARRQLDILSTVTEPAYNAVQYLHLATGLEWHYLIPITTLLLRSCVTLPFAIANRKRAQKQQRLQPLLSALSPILKARLASSTAAKDGTLTPSQIEVLASKERRKRRIALFKQYKCQTWKSLISLPTIQMPLWITMSLTFRAMCGWTVVEGIPTEAGFSEDSFLWLSSLIEADPYSILPMAIGAFGLANVEWNVANTMSPNSIGQAQRGPVGPSVPAIVGNISRLGVLACMAVAIQAPAAVSLYWMSSSAFSLVQNLVLDKYYPLRQALPQVEIDARILQSVAQSEEKKV